MKITMYELLGLVKDDKAPKKIKYRDTLYEYDDYEEFYFNDGWSLYRQFCAYGNCLNDEVEILEEEKKAPTLNDIRENYGLPRIEEKEIPEKLDIRQEKNIKNNWKWKVYGEEHSYNISTPQKIIADKLNEVLDYLESKGE